MKAQKDMYLKHLQALLRSKQQIEKEAFKEKNQRQRLDDQILQMKVQMEHEIRNMRVRIDEEYRTQYQEKHDLMVSRFHDESKNIYN